MTTKKIAATLVDMCREGKVEEAKEVLFAPDIISIEPHEGLLPRETKGMDAIRKKADYLFHTVENFYGNVISQMFGKIKSFPE